MRDIYKIIRPSPSVNPAGRASAKVEDQWGWLVYNKGRRIIFVARPEHQWVINISPMFVVGGGRKGPEQVYVEAEFRSSLDGRQMWLEDIKRVADQPW